MDKRFFERINEIEKILIEEYNFEIISDKKDYILKFIKEFKTEYCRKVMNENIYSCYLILNKNKKSDNFGICGWIPKFYSKYKISLKDMTYEKKKLYCHLTENEEKFNFTYKKNLTFYLCFLKKNIIMIIGIIYLQVTLLNLKENILMKLDKNVVMATLFALMTIYAKGINLFIF